MSVLAQCVKDLARIWCCWRGCGCGEAGSYSSDLTPGLGTSICRRYSPKKKFFFLIISLFFFLFLLFCFFRFAFFLFSHCDKNTY